MIETVFLDFCPRPLECRLNAQAFQRSFLKTKGVFMCVWREEKGS